LAISALRNGGTSASGMSKGTPASAAMRSFTAGFASAFWISLCSLSTTG
jgi:hypothetical protein